MSNRLNVEREIQNFFKKNDNTSLKQNSYVGHKHTNINTAHQKTEKESESYNEYHQKLINTKSAPVSKITNVKFTKNLPFVVHPVSNPTRQPKTTIETLSSNSPLKNTFGNGDSKSAREKRKDETYNLQKTSDSVGYTKFTMKGVDVLYSFPKPNLEKATKRRKKQITTSPNKSQDAGPYVDYDTNHGYIGRYMSTFTFLRD